MADVQFDISLKNNGSGTEGLTIFAPVMATSQKANKYAFSTPFISAYPAGTVFTIVDDSGTSTVTLNAEMTMAEAILLLNALNIGTFILAFNDATNGNVFHLLSIRNPQTLSIDNNNYTAGVFTSVDTGAFAPPPASHIAFIDADRVVIGASDNTLFLSIDAGNTFNIIALPGSAGTDNVYQIQFISALVGFCVLSDATDSKIFKTSDAGDTWSLVATHLNKNLSGIWMFDENNGLIYGEDAGVNYKVFSTIDGGVNITAVQTIGDRAGAIQFVNANAGFIFLSHPLANLLLRTTDGGATWASTNVTQINGGFALDENNVWVVGDTGSVQYSNDGGVTFVPKNIATANNLSSIHALSTQHLIVGRQGRQWVRSTDGGLTWQNTLIAAGGTATNLRFYDQYYGIAHDSLNTIYKYS